jgi:hypothetical protein
LIMYSVESCTCPQPLDHSLSRRRPSQPHTYCKLLSVEPETKFIYQAQVQHVSRAHYASSHFKTPEHTLLMAYIADICISVNTSTYSHPPSSSVGSYVKVPRNLSVLSSTKTV